MWEKQAKPFNSLFLPPFLKMQMAIGPYATKLTLLRLDHLLAE